MNKQTIQDLFDVTGKVALITGATGGFGKAAATALAAAGAQVVITGRTLSKLEECAGQTGAKACLVGEPTNGADVARVSRPPSMPSGASIFSSPRGVNKPGAIHEQPVDEWEMIMDANVKGTYLFCKEAGKAMITRGQGGKMILVGSVRGLLGLSRYTGYCPSKAAVHLLAKTLGCEFGPHKINVNCVAPAVFRTELTQWI